LGDASALTWRPRVAEQRVCEHRDAVT
jgi:hypothetical protein